MSTERFFDNLARTLAVQMPRRRAVRVIGASLATLAVPGISPAAGAVRPERQGGLGETCPDGSECTGRGEKCCDRPNAHGAYNCVPPGKICCCGNALCDPVKQRCLCTPGGGYCAPKCGLTYGRNWKDCGRICCQPHGRSVDEVKGKCVSCEQEGKQTCRSYDDKTTVICCPATRGSYSPCCANTRSATCCGPKQRCKSEGMRTVQCTCKRGEGDKCGPDCCKRNETCCNRRECCSSGETCTLQGCCPADRAVCTDNKGKQTVCCDDGEFCLWKAGVDDAGDPLIPLASVCKRGCAPGNRAGKQCCGTGYKPNRRKTACVLG